MSGEKVIRCGWVSKKNTHSFPSGLYSRRFLVLDSKQIRYFHDAPDDIIAVIEAETEFILPLHEVMEAVLLKCDDPTLGYFEIVTDTRRYRFKTSLDEAELWVRDITNAKEAPVGNTTRPLLYMETSKAAVPKTNSTLGGVMKSLTGLIARPNKAAADEAFFSIDQAHALQRLLDFMSISGAVSAAIINAVFDSLQQLTKAEKSRASRQLGQVLAMWLGETTDAARNRRRASMASVSRSGHSSQIDILRDWLEIGLSREFRETCNFEIQSSSGPLRAATSATTAAVSDSLGYRVSAKDQASQSESKSGEGGASNTPLRRDNVECLFLASFIKGVAQNTGMLSLWLRPSLIRVASEPEAYTMPVRKSGANFTTGVGEQGEAQLSAGDGDVCSTGTKLRDIEDRVDTECMNLFDLMRAEEAAIPYSMRLLISTIRNLTIGRGDKESSAADQKLPASGDGATASLTNSTKAEESNVFYASSCAVLFLRLICPSVISPLEWGALRMERGSSGATGTTPSSSSLGRGGVKRSGDKSGAEDCGTGTDGDDLDVLRNMQKVESMSKNPAAAAIILVAHILKHEGLASIWQGDDAGLRALEQLVYEVVMVVPIDKLAVLVETYEASSRSIVDASTKKAFESAEVRKALVGYAKAIQRIANLSVLPESEIRHHAVDTQIRLSIAAGNADRVKEFAAATEAQSPTHKILSAHETVTVKFQAQAALAVKQLYDTFAMMASKSVGELVLADFNHLEAIL